jgi:hypothetical protein
MVVTPTFTFSQPHFIYAETEIIEKNQTLSQKNTFIFERVLSRTKKI